MLVLGVPKAPSHPEVSTPTFVVEKPPTNMVIDKKGQKDESISMLHSQPEFLLSLAKSPINIENLRAELSGYDQDRANEIDNGFSYGFPLYYAGERRPSESKI